MSVGDENEDQEPAQAKPGRGIRMLPNVALVEHSRISDSGHHLYPDIFSVRKTPARSLRRAVSPWPVFRTLHESPRHRIAMEITQLLDELALAPHVEVVIIGEFETQIPRVLAAGAAADGSNDNVSKFRRQSFPTSRKGSEKWGTRVRSGASRIRKGSRAGFDCKEISRREEKRGASR